MKPLFRILGRCAAVLSVIALVGSATFLHAQDVRRVTGKVLDAETKEPLLGAVIKVKGTKVGTVVRRSDGEFSIDVPTNSSQILVVSLVGKVTEEVNVAGRENVTIYLKNDVLELQKVVVTAVGIEREKRSLGYATQEISGTSISQNREQNLVNALVGKVAGVQINSSSGSPGSASYIRLRGVNSISFNNQPAFVVDGVLIDNSDYAAFTNASNASEGVAGNSVSSVDQVSRILDINPDDIESINVLKGAAATSLYGLAASAGAIVITTKKGRRDGTVNVQYSYNTTFDQVNKLPELQNKYSQGLNGRYQGPQTGQGASWGALIDTLRYDPTTPNPWDKNGTIKGVSDAPNGKPVTPYDNPKNFFVTGGTTTHSLAISSGSSWGSYYFGITDARTTGVVPLSNFQRTSLRLNGDVNLGSDLKLNAAAQYVRSGGRRVQKGSNISGVMLGLLRTPPTFDNSNGYGADAINHPDAYSFPDGRQRTYRGYGIYDNPFWTVTQNAYTDATDRFIGSAQLDYYPERWFGQDAIGDFSATFRVGMDQYATQEKNILAINSATAPAGRVVVGDVRNRNINADLLLTFKREVTSDIQARLTLGAQIFNNDFLTTGVIGDQLTVPKFYDISNAVSYTPYASNGILRRLGTFFDAQLSFKEMLYLNGSYRVERSTTLPKDNNAFGYGNISASFVFSELFKEEESFLSFGKLRLSYATVGSDAPLYALTTPFTRGTISDGWVATPIQWPLNGVPGFIQSATLGNNSLRPEKREEVEAGIELKFFENRIGLDVTWYQTRNVDQILQVPITPTTGFPFQFLNAGTMKNSGIEAVLHLVPYTDEDWNIALDINFSTFNNTVEALAPGIETILLSGFVGTSVRAVAGQPYGQIYGPGWKRDPQGRIVVDANGLPIVDPTERVWGSFIPDWIMGGNLTISYGGLSLNAILDWKQGGKMWNGTKGALVFFGTAKVTENRGALNGTFAGVTLRDGVVEGVVEQVDDQGNVTYVPNTKQLPNGADQTFWRTRANSFTANNTEPYVEDAGWIRLREVTLSYRLPGAVTTALGFVKGIDLFLTGRNLFLSTKYTGVDPETSLVGSVNGQGIDYFNNPGIRTYGFGIRANF
ncbi:MAG: SusC/RagA family TonB-linked outer membrane protein [Candidatus Kapaibacterium sp.]|nr:MAG: SusC/RagA family TonB-linked outer membrane protein [Candidatus Kapabacteria bacterium]